MGYEKSKDKLEIKINEIMNSGIDIAKQFINKDYLLDLDKKESNKGKLECYRLPRHLYV